MATITEEQRKEYIKEVQTFLRTISQFDERIPRVAVDGIYDEQTADVVGIFQKIAGLPVTNEVDKATFDAIFNAFVAIERINEQAEKIVGFPNKDTVLNIGDKGFEVYLLQVMLNELSQRFNNIEKVAITGTYDQNTENALNQFKKSANITADGLDKDSWNIVARSFNNTHKEN